jgi:hypothetical protein
MSTSPGRSQPDPMAREVDRLLAGLSHVGRPSGQTTAPRPVIHTGSARVASSPKASARGDAAALWGRALLGVVLGGLMTQWPYSHGCGLPLLGYLGAVAMVMLAGAWIAFASWKLRAGTVHILGLILFFWGIVLAAEQLLPRIGYAAERGSWYCPL